MTSPTKHVAAAAGSIAAVAMIGLAVEMPAASYFHAPPGGPPAWSTGRSFYGAGVGSGYGTLPYAATPMQAPAWSSWGAPAISPYTASPYGAASYGATPYGGVYSNPRGRMSYDVQTPTGTVEHHYRFRRDGSFRFDIDD